MSNQDSPQASPELLVTQPPAAQPMYSGDPIILARFSAMAQQGLEKATKKITTELKKEFRKPEDHIQTIKNKLDAMVRRTNQNTVFATSRIS